MGRSYLIHKATIVTTYHVLADINAAYVSFCTLFNPHLKNKPCGVLSSNQGNVVARNQNIKDLGVKMGAPAFSVRSLVASQGGHLWGSNFTFFGDMSDRFHLELEELIISPERYSVDEAFGLLDTECMTDIKSYTGHIQKTIKQNLGLEIGVGVGRTKTLAKLANWFCKEKRFKHITNGVAVIDTIERENWVLKHVFVNDIWGVGAKTTLKLEGHGITTGLDLRDADLKQMRSLYGVTLERTILELRGINAITLKGYDSVREQICVSRSMGIIVTKLSTLKASLSSHVNDASYKLRQQGSYCKRMTIFIATNSFNKSEQQYNNSLSIEFPRSTNSTTILTKYALFVLEQVFKEGFNYRKTGVVLSELSDIENIQPDLFDGDDNGSPFIDEALDKINAKFGKGVIRLACEHTLTKWKPKDDLAPPSYTTNIMEIPTAR
jgi:DNA polymerase V